MGAPIVLVRVEMTPAHERCSFDARPPQGGGRCGSVVLADDLRLETGSFTPPASLQRTQRVRAVFASKSARLPPQLVHLSGFLWSLANPLRSSSEPRQAEPPAHPHAAST